MKYYLLLILAFAACKGPQQVQQQSNNWQKQAETMFGKDFKQKMNSANDKVLVYKLTTTKTLALFDLKWAVWNSNTAKLLCKGSQSASGVDWKTNTQLTFSKAKEMVEKGADNRYEENWDVVTCKKTSRKNNP